MKSLLKLFLVLSFLTFFTLKSWAFDTWNNDLKTLFLSKKAVIYAVNIRTFGANDSDKNGIIEKNLEEESGNFTNAVKRLDDLKISGVNTILLMPVTTTGKIKALGTAGSLYAAASFSEINPQLKNPNSELSIEDEAKNFIKECHKRKIRVMVDLPCCGAYDLYLKRPELFKKDKSQNPITPADWTDVRLLDAGSEQNINQDVYNLYAQFVDMALNLGIDGIRAGVPSVKPAAFWKKLISETKGRNPEFLFLAEASELWNEPVCDGAVFTSYKKLLDAGFDGYYGNYFNIKNWKTAQDLYSSIKSDKELSEKYGGKIASVGSFSTHDEISPILINGKNYSKMIIWLSATLPLNSCFVDGFDTGDDYIYFWANRKAFKTYTDDEDYFVHRGKIDIFNFSRRPGGKHNDIKQEFLTANNLKQVISDAFSEGKFTTHKTSSNSIFAYSRSTDKFGLIVVGNLDFRKSQNAVVYLSKLKTDSLIVPVKMNNIPKVSNGKIVVRLEPGEVLVMYVPKF